MDTDSETQKKWADLLKNLFPVEVALSCQPVPFFEEVKSSGARYGIRLPEGLKSASVSRQRDYFAGRYCARQALYHMGFSGCLDIPKGKDGCPIWPRGVVGSISHAEGLAVAVVTNWKNAQGIGIDLEKKVSDREGKQLLPVIATRNETAIITTRFPNDTGAAFTTLFSAKEAIYKALYPLVGHFFDFSEARLTGYHRIDHRLEFDLSADLLKKTGVSQFHVSFGEVDTYVVTGSVC